MIAARNGVRPFPVEKFHEEFAMSIGIGNEYGGFWGWVAGMENSRWNYRPWPSLRSLNPKEKRLGAAADSKAMQVSIERDGVAS